VSLIYARIVLYSTILHCRIYFLNIISMWYVGLLVILQSRRFLSCRFSETSFITDIYMTLFTAEFFSFFFERNKLSLRVWDNNWEKAIWLIPILSEWGICFNPRSDGRSPCGAIFLLTLLLKIKMQIHIECYAVDPSNDKHQQTQSWRTKHLLRLWNSSKNVQDSAKLNEFGSYLHQTVKGRDFSTGILRRSASHKYS